MSIMNVSIMILIVTESVNNGHLDFYFDYDLVNAKSTCL